MQSHNISFRTQAHTSHDPDTVVSYGHKPDHRDNTRGKAQWLIKEADERAIFTTAMANCWTEKKFAWSLYRPQGQVAVLGVDRDHQTEVFIARFDEHSTAAWHGYPCNHKEPQQRPPPSVLNDWLNQRIFSAAKIRKITWGQRCAI